MQKQQQRAFSGIIRPDELVHCPAAAALQLKLEAYPNRTQVDPGLRLVLAGGVQLHA
jgi:hypothetical protein